MNWLRVCVCVYTCVCLIALEQSGTIHRHPDQVKALMKRANELISLHADVQSKPPVCPQHYSITDITSWNISFGRLGHGGGMLEIDQAPRQHRRDVGDRSSTASPHLPSLDKTPSSWRTQAETKPTRRPPVSPESLLFWLGERNESEGARSHPSQDTKDRTNNANYIKKKFF